MRDCFVFALLATWQLPSGAAGTARHGSRGVSRAPSIRANGRKATPSPSGLPTDCSSRPRSPWEVRAVCRRGEGAGISFFGLRVLRPWRLPFAPSAHGLLAFNRATGTVAPSGRLEAPHPALRIGRSPRRVRGAATTLNVAAAGDGPRVRPGVTGGGWAGSSHKRDAAPSPLRGGMEWGMGGKVPKSGAGAWEHPLPAPLGLSAKLRYLPHQGGGVRPAFVSPSCNSRRPSGQARG